MADYHFSSHTPDDLIWRQYGIGIVEQYPETEWEYRIKQAPPLYQDYIRERICKRKAARTTREGYGGAP